MAVTSYEVRQLPSRRKGDRHPPLSEDGHLWEELLGPRDSLGV